MSDSLFYAQLVLRYLHIMGAIALFGGSLFARVAIVPTLAALPEADRQKLHEQIRSRWGKVVHIAVAALLISGIANLGLASQYNFESPGFKTFYNAAAGMKFLLALPIFFFASMLVGRSATAAKFQQNAGRWLTLNIILAVVIVLIGGVLKFVDKKPKSSSVQPTMQRVIPAEPVTAG